MWHDGRIYFLSDQGGTANLWRMRARRQRSHPPHRLRRLGRPLAGHGPGRAHRLHPRRPTCTCSIRQRRGTAGRDRPAQRPRADPHPLPRLRSATCSGFDLSPDGERVLAVVRGEIFSVPVKEGVTLPVTRGTGARERCGHLRPRGQAAGLPDRRRAARTTCSASTPGAAASRDVRKPAARSDWHFAAGSGRRTASGSPAPTARPV